MKPSAPSVSEKMRADPFSTRPVIKVWQEVASPENPYVTGQSRCHGYDLLELVKNASFIEVLFLLFRGELPTSSQAELLEKWWIASISPGPRHPAARAAMNAAVGKTNVANILPLSLTVLGGAHLGAAEVKQAMRFLKKNIEKEPTAVATGLLREGIRPEQGDWHIAPGFGNRFGSVDHMPRQIGNLLSTLRGAGPALKWGAAFARALETDTMSWLDPAVAAATLADLGFDEHTSIGLFQLSRAPGLLAHGMEMDGKPVTAMPFPDDGHYIIEK